MIMSEHMEPIPSRIYNAAVGGHVTGADQIIDDETGLTLDEVAGGALEEKIYTSGSDNGMGRVVLRKNLIEGVNTLVQTMINKSNTIYIIQYDFTLGENITIPANCVLEFDGGSLNGNYTLTLNKTYIQGNAKFDVTLAGDISNEVFNVLWMKGNDIGEQINKAGVNFKALIVPQGNYTFTTPVVLSGVSYLNCLATLKYNGTKKNCEGIFLIKNSNRATIQIASLYPYDTNFDYSDSRTINFVGLEVRNCNDCNFVIGSIGYFNENLRISGIAKDGSVGQCSDNIWLLKSLHNGNFNVRIYQEGGGYCNEQNFIGGHLANYTSSINYGRKYYFGIGGPAIDLDSYLPNKPSDSYDSVNAIKIIDMELETDVSGANRTPAFLFRNTTNLSLVRNRFEGQGNLNTPQNKAIGSFGIVEYVVSYDDILPYIDISGTNNAVSIPFSGIKTKLVIPDKKTLNGLWSPYVCSIANVDNGIVNSPVGTYDHSMGFIVDTSVNKRVKFKSNKVCRFIVYYLDANNNNITPQNSTNGCKFGYYEASWKSFSSGSNTIEGSVFVPSDINKVFIGIPLSLTNGATEFEIEAVQGTVVISYPVLYGATSNRPSTGLPANVSYYDTTINKKIWYNGNSTTGWCDANGATV